MFSSDFAESLKPVPLMVVEKQALDRRSKKGGVTDKTRLCKFIPNLAQITQPIRKLLVKSNQWMWKEPQQTASKKPLSQVQF